MPYLSEKDKHWSVRRLGVCIKISFFRVIEYVWCTIKGIEQRRSPSPSVVQKLSANELRVNLKILQLH